MDNHHLLKSWTICNYETFVIKDPLLCFAKAEDAFGYRKKNKLFIHILA